MPSGDSSKSITNYLLQGTFCIFYIDIWGRGGGFYPFQIGGFCVHIIRRFLQTTVAFLERKLHRESADLCRPTKRVAGNVVALNW